MRTFLAALVSASLIVSTAMAADSSGILAPGKPAGVKQAQISTPAIVLLGFAVVVGIAVGVASSNGSSGASPNIQENFSTSTTS